MHQKTSTTPAIEIPEEIICSITSQIMTDPVMLMASGHTYEREAIVKWLENNNTDPLTNIVLENKKISLNIAVKKMIIRFLEEHPELIEDTYLPGSLIKNLIESIQKNDLKAFTEFLGKDIRLLSKDLEENKDLLTLCCESASFEILKVVLERMGNHVLKIPNVSKDKGLSLFLMASRRLGLEGARILSKAFYWETSDSQSLLNTAVKDDDLVFAKIALSLGATTTFELLNQAYTSKKTKMIKVLASAGVLLNEKDNGDLLIRAIEDDYVEFSEFLLTEMKETVNPNISNVSKETVLNKAIEKNQINVVQALLNHPKINLNQKDWKGETALHAAVGSNNLEAITLLIQEKAEINIETPNGETPLSIAYKNNHIETLKLLILSGAAIGNLLVQAIENERKELIQFLLIGASHVTDPNIYIANQKSVLMLAAEKKQTETIFQLLNHPKINIHQMDAAGNKVLHYATWANHRESVKMLMKRGASIKDKNNTNKTPLQLAQESNHQELVSWMKEKHRAKKIKPFIKPLQLEIASQKEKLGEQEKIIMNQQAEIENLKKSHQEQVSFFTPRRKEMIVLQEKKMQQKQQEQAYQAARKQEREKARQQKIQELFIAALVEGNLVEAQKLELGASLTEPNTHGLYPLVAAVYGTNLEAVRYLELKLKDEALKQWSAVDVKTALDKVMDMMPSKLKGGATYSELCDWYKRERDKKWCVRYDKECLSRSNGCKSWMIQAWERRNEVWEQWQMDTQMNYEKWGWVDSKTDYGQRVPALKSPSRQVHDDVVEAIRESLNKLRKDIETKTGIQPFKAIKF